MRLNANTAKVLATELIGIITAKDLLELDGKKISNSEFNIIPDQISQAIPYEKDNVYKITVSNTITIFFVYVSDMDYKAEKMKHYPCWIVRKCT